MSGSGLIESLEADWSLTHESPASMMRAVATWRDHLLHHHGITHPFRGETPQQIVDSLRGSQDFAYNDLCLSSLLTVYRDLRSGLAVTTILHALMPAIKRKVRYLISHGMPHDEAASDMISGMTLAVEDVSRKTIVRSVAKWLICEAWKNRSPISNEVPTDPEVTASFVKEPDEPSQSDTEKFLSGDLDWFEAKSALVQRKMLSPEDLELLDATIQPRSDGSRGLNYAAAAKVCNDQRLSNGKEPLSDAAVRQRVSRVRRRAAEQIQARRASVLSG